jgi:hypothetical protein
VKPLFVDGWGQVGEGVVPSSAWGGECVGANDRLAGQAERGDQRRRMPGINDDGGDTASTVAPDAVSDAGKLLLAPFSSEDGAASPLSTRDQEQEWDQDRERIRNRNGSRIRNGNGIRIRNGNGIRIRIRSGIRNGIRSGIRNRNREQERERGRSISMERPNRVRN